MPQLRCPVSGLSFYDRAQSYQHRDLVFHRKSEDIMLLLLDSSCVTLSAFKQQLNKSRSPTAYRLPKIMDPPYHYSTPRS